MIDRTPPSVSPRARRVVKTCVVCNARFLIAAKKADRYSTCSDLCSRERKRVTARRSQPHSLPRRRKEGALLSRYLTENGYVRGCVWRGDRLVKVAEHRWVMEQAIGRPLRPEERIHHINRDTADNRIENLRVYASQAEHVRAEHRKRAKPISHSQAKTTFIRLRTSTLWHPGERAGTRVATNRPTMTFRRSNAIS